MKTRDKTILITGGAGFIGTNLVEYFSPRNSVIVLDSLGRRGSETNLARLQRNHSIRFLKADVSAPGMWGELRDILPPIDVVVHLAAQVAVTTSVEDPEKDFLTNALGTLNVLEYARRQEPKPTVIFSSTNKVYGALEQLALRETDSRHEFMDRDGIDESSPLDFHSPYGCSKGCADQYVADYARIFDLPTVVFRQSCIYGAHQFGIEDQGWVAWFLIAALLGRPITVFGDGKQVRDLLHVSDLALAFDRAINRIGDLKGRAFNLGGGPRNAISLREFLAFIRSRFGLDPKVNYAPARAGDQKIFISDNSSARKFMDWKPTIGWPAGVTMLYDWLMENLDTIRVVSPANPERLAA